MIQAILDLLVGRCGGSIRSIYLFGSHHDGTALETSDIDLAIVTDDPAPGLLLDQLKTDLAVAGIQGVDLIVFDREQLVAAGHFRIERGSRLLLGEDVRPYLPTTTVESYLRRYGEAPINYMSNVLRNGYPIQHPLDYPDSNGEFLGYDRDTLPPDGRPAHNVKALVACACWIATMTVGFRTGRMISSTGEGIRAYQTDIADNWTPLLTEIYANGRQRWHYLVPDDPAERRRLRDLCARMLDLERHYLDVYADRLQALMQGSEQDAAHAYQMLQRTGRG